MAPTALITGASRGIGRGIALNLARLGYRLGINFLGNETAARETVAVCMDAGSPEAMPMRADISLAADRAQLLTTFQQAFGRIDLLVNNAGVAPNVRADLLDTSEESFDRLWQINVKGPFFLTQAAVKLMIAQKPASVARKVVVISSISAYTASVNRGEYCVSKAALSMITPLFAARLAEHGIGVFEIRPGIIETDMTSGVREKYDKLIADGLTPIPRWGTPDDVGRAVAAIAQDAFPFSTGEIFNVDGGFHLRRL